MTPKKLTFHVLVSPDDNSIAGVRAELFEKPFSFAPYDTIYGQDFDVMAYTPDDISELQDIDIRWAAGCEGVGKAKELGLIFHAK